MVLWDRLAYWLENAVAADPSARFYLLGAATLVVCVVLAAVWASQDADGELSGGGPGGEFRFADTLFNTFQVWRGGAHGARAVETRCQGGGGRPIFLRTFLVCGAGSSSD